MPLEVGFWNRADPTGARDALLETLRYELLGPLEPEEEIEESPLTRYLVGMLAPFGTVVAPEEDEVLDTPGGTEDEGDPPDVGSDQVGEGEAAPPMSNALFPSSIGMSCLVPSEVRHLLLSVRWGDYERLREADEEDPKSQSIVMSRSTRPASRSVDRPSAGSECRRKKPGYPSS
jgi:hypothetical protein